MTMKMEMEMKEITMMGWLLWWRWWLLWWWWNDDDDDDNDDDDDDDDADGNGDDVSSCCWCWGGYIYNPLRAIVGFICAPESQNDEPVVCDANVCENKITMNNIVVLMSGVALQMHSKWTTRSRSKKSHLTASSTHVKTICDQCMVSSALNLVSPKLWPPSAASSRSTVDYW